MRGGASASATTAAPAAGGETKAGEAKAPEKDVKTTTLKLAFNQSEKHPQYLALSEMSDAFYEATGGAYRIEISPNELLGSQKDAFELVQSGTIQMAMVANSIVENVNPDFAVLGLPYAYDSVEHQKRYLPAEPWTISLQVQKPTISALWRHLQQERAAFIQISRFRPRLI